VYLYSSTTTALEVGEWSAVRPGRTLPPGKSRYPFCRRLGGPQGRSEQAENLVPTRTRSRTVHPVPTELRGILIIYIYIYDFCTFVRNGFVGYLEENKSNKIILTEVRVICNSGLREYLR